MTRDDVRCAATIAALSVSIDSRIAKLRVSWLTGSRELAFTELLLPPKCTVCFGPDASPRRLQFMTPASGLSHPVLVAVVLLLITVCGAVLAGLGSGAASSAGAWIVVVGVITGISFARGAYGRNRGTIRFFLCARHSRACRAIEACRQVSEAVAVLAAIPVLLLAPSCVVVAKMAASPEVPTLYLPRPWADYLVAGIAGPLVVAGLLFLRAWLQRKVKAYPGLIPTVSRDWKTLTISFRNADYAELVSRHWQNMSGG